MIVAVFNVRDHVAAAIASLRAQSLADFEALVVDDGSTDGSDAVALAAIDGDPRFRLMRQANGGLSAARNAGLETARGAFVAFLDGDDAYAPDFLSALHGAMIREGADWAASAITLWFPDGREMPHPALHATPEAQPAGAFDLSDARLAARVFPSAWNKLYRRSVLGDLRFPLASWFEDHEFFWACAARRPKLAYVSASLYRHRRDRAGQITGSDSDRVFEQFAVLQRLRPLILSGGFRHAQDGFARLATRLVHERAMVLRDRDRRARFLAAARARFDDWDLRYAPDWDPTISRGLGMAMAGVLPLSVVVIAPDGDTPALAATLQALDRQGMADFDLHVLAAADAPLPDRLACGLTVQRAPVDLSLADLCARLVGVRVVIYAPGERPAPDGLLWLVNLIDRTGLPLAIGGFNRDGAGYHDGWTDNTVIPTDLPSMLPIGEALELTPDAALRLFPALGNHIFGKGLLAALPGPAPTDAGAVQALVLGAALAAGRAGYTRLAVAETPDAPARIAGVGALARWARSLPDPGGGRLPRGWRGVLFLRLVRLRGAGHGAAGVLEVVVRAWWAGLLRAGPGAAPDPETGPVLRRIWRLWRLRQR